LQTEKEEQDDGFEPVKLMGMPPSNLAIERGASRIPPADGTENNGSNPYDDLSRNDR
jgi:hypothetical protein